MPIPKKKNVNFFKVWSPDMAYVLGFFAADGAMIRNRRGACFIEFHITDRELLESIRAKLGSDHKVSCFKGGRDAWKDRFRLQIGSKEMFADLLALGMTPDKSLTLAMPDVPGEYFSDFVRGYFDGDGNVYANEYSRKGRDYRSVTLLVGLTCGSRSFLEALHGRLRNRGVVRGGSLFAREGYFRLHYSVRDSCKLYGFMYNTESGLFLLRKKVLFERYFERKDIIPRKHSLGA
jgi:hypothetical protein